MDDSELYDLDENEKKDTSSELQDSNEVAEIFAKEEEDESDLDFDQTKETFCNQIVPVVMSNMCRFMSPFSEIDHFISLFMLGLFTSGLFYGKETIFLHFSGVSLVIALNICFDKYHADKATITFTLSCIYLWFIFAICVDFYPSSIIGACELGYSIQRSISRNAVDAESAAMIAISLNSMIEDSYVNTVIIFIYSLCRSTSKWNDIIKLCMQSEDN